MVWRHTRRGDKYVVAVTIDLIPVRRRSGLAAPGLAAWLLDVVEDQPIEAGVQKTWLSERDETWLNPGEVAAMDGFIEFKTAAAGELTDDTVVLDAFHVALLAGHSLELGRRRV